MWTISPYKHNSHYEQVKVLMNASNLICEAYCLPEIGLVLLWNPGGGSEPLPCTVGGYIGAHIKYPEHAHIDILVVKEDVRKGGLATLLMHHMGKVLESLGVISGSIELHTDNAEAATLYLKLGIRLESRLVGTETVSKMLLATSYLMKEHDLLNQDCE